MKIVLSEMQKISVDVNSENVIKDTVTLLISSDNIKEIEKQNKHI